MPGGRPTLSAPDPYFPQGAAPRVPDSPRHARGPRPSTRRAWPIALGALAVASSIASRAAAQPSGQDVATAQALFDEGKRLLQAGNAKEACPKLVESQRLDPAGGTLIAIALCHEAEGKTATAWADFTLALGEARKDRRADRETAASEHIRALEPKLTRVKVIVASRASGLEVRRDGSLIGEAQYGTPLPIDPGEHAFEAKAPQKQTWSSVVNVQGEGKTVEVTIPALADAPVPPTPPPTEPAPAPKPAPAPTSEGLGTQRTLALVAAGIGVVAAGVGVGFAASANAQWSDAERACPNTRCRNPADLALGEDAGRSADVATGLFILAGAGLAAGAALWFTAGSSSAAKASLRATPIVSSTTLGFGLGGAL